MSDPNKQYTQYITYAEDKENLPYTKLTETQIENLHTDTDLCSNMCRARNPLYTLTYQTTCEIMNGVILAPTDPTEQMKFNVYNIKLPCLKIHPLCYDFQYVVDFFNNKQVQDYIGVSEEWQPCSSAPGAALRKGDWWNRAAGQLSEMLDSGVHVLVYSGDLDYICNWKGGDLWTRNVSWGGQDDFRSAKWKDVPEDYGQVRGDAQLKFMRVYQAGHMVPLDKPEGSVKMLNNFMDEALSGKINFLKE